jgi:hypothetical protein
MQLDRRLMRALAAGDCVGGAAPDAASVSEVIGHLIEDLDSFCGNGVSGGTEVCDGIDDDTCPTVCRRSRVHRVLRNDVVVRRRR